MENYAATLVPTLAMGLVNVSGTAFLRVSAEPNKQAYYAAGVVAYVISAALYVGLLKEHGMAVMAVASSILQLGLMISLSIWFFDEKLNFVLSTAMAIALAGAAVAMLAATN